MNVILRPVRGNYRITFNFADHEKWRDDHPGVSYNPGIDFYSDDRSIYSCDAGVVDKTGVDPSGYGNYIKLKHSWGYSLYAHLLLLPTFPIGYEMIPGMIIGQMGYSGNVRPTGPNGTHLHFETRDQNQVPFDPEPFFESVASETVQTTTKESSETSGWAEVVCPDGANMRTLPAGSLKSWLPKGVRVHLTGNSSVANILAWVEIEGGYWIARADSEGTVLIEDIYE